MHAVYVIQNDVSNEIYIGYTSNLKARLDTHNAGGKKSTTRKVGIWRYIYIELFRSKEDAQERERKLKAHGSAKQKLLTRLRKSLLWAPNLGLGRSERFPANCLTKTQLSANTKVEV